MALSPLFSRWNRFSASSHRTRRRNKNRQNKVLPTLQSLEPRLALSISPVAQTVAAVESATFSGPVAAFTDSNASAKATDFTASIVWGDGATSTGAVGGVNGHFTVTGNHSYAEEGSLPVTVMLMGNSPSTATATAHSTASVAEADRLTASSTAIAATEGTTFTGAVASFADARAAASASNFTATIAWGDGSTTAGAISGSNGHFTVTGSHDYADEGSLPVTVILKDNSPGTAAATAHSTASVAEADRLTARSQAISATEGTLFSGTVATFSDTNAAAGPSGYTATINWGDGTITAGAVSGVNGQFTVTGSHRYLRTGVFNVNVTLTDTAPGTAAATALSTATVAMSDTVTAAGETLAATEGTAFSGAVATFTDSNRALPATDFTAIVVWGDGATTTGAVQGSNGGFTVTGTHVFTDEGVLPLSVTVRESASSSATATAHSTARVAEADRLAASSTAIAATEATLFSGTVASFSDANAAASASNFAASIAWGDGSTSIGTVSGLNGRYTVSGSHIYAVAGSFTVFTDVRDTAPGTATARSAALAQVAASLTSNQPIVASGTPVIGHERSQLVDASVATFRQGNNTEPPGRYLATIDWGDGTRTTGMVAKLGTEYVVKGSHNYLDEGSFTISVLISIGARSATATAPATISEELLYNGTTGTADQRFINEVYRDLLGRGAEASGLNYWTSHLTRGDNRSKVVLDIENDMAFAERRKDEVRTVFLALLQRPAEPAAVDFYANMMVHGDTMAQVEGMLAGSPEYFQKHAGGSNQGWLNSLFHDALGRNVDPASSPGLLQKLNQGVSRAQLADTIFGSPEYLRDFTNKAYGRYLGTTAGPAASGVSSSAMRSKTPDHEVIATVLASNQYFARIAR